MLRRLSVVKWPRLSVRPKSTAAAESPQAPKEGEGPGLFRSARTYLRSGGREDLSAIGIGFGGLAVGAGAIYYIVGSVQSSHEKISILTKIIESAEKLCAEGIQKERELRAKDIEKERELRAKGIQNERELRAKDIQKERELRAKDIESAEKLRGKDIESAEKLRAEGIQNERELRAKDAVLLSEGIQKERELREKDAAIMRAERIAYENELRAAKLELQNARGK